MPVASALAFAGAETRQPAAPQEQQILHTRLKCFRQTPQHLLTYPAPQAQQLLPLLQLAAHTKILTEAIEYDRGWKMNCDGSPPDPISVIFPKSFVSRVFLMQFRHME